MKVKKVKVRQALMLALHVLFLVVHLVHLIDG